MAGHRALTVLCLVALVLLLASPVAAFGAGNIASISKIEGHNWRHGDIEDLLTTVAFIRGHKWTSMMVKRTYFGNWLRDYSQAVDVGTLKGVQADTIRVLVWVLAFMSFGYATQEFEVTAERLGVYRPEEHIDNPKDYADNQDARQFDSRLRGPVMPVELEIDPRTGMKNYIANENGDWATSLGYIKWTFARSIHFGRLYTHGANKGREEDLCEALRCLGQGLHCMEDFGAHTNYTELALRELGYNNVFPHVGTQTSINLHGKNVFPLVTGTFGGVDFLHSVLGEATDHVTQSEVDKTEVDQLNAALSQASASQNRGLGDPSSNASGLTDLLSKIPGTGGLIQEAMDLQAASDAQAAENERTGATRGVDDNNNNDSYTPYGDQYGSSRAPQAPQAGNTGSNTFAAPPGSQGGPPGPGIPGVNVNIDPQAAIAKIYPLLAFRDKVVRSIAGIVAKIPGLEKAIETISEKVTLFVMGLLAPYVKPIIAAASNALKQGSGTVVSASAQQQYLVWEDARSSDPTHSMLSKDHFSNLLNEPAGQIAAVILQYVAPRVLYAWDHPAVPEREVLADIARVFHHPAARDPNVEVQRAMFAVVEKWAHARPGGGAHDLNQVLSAESVRAGRNHQVQNMAQSVQGLQQGLQGLGLGTSSHSTTSGGPFAMLAGKRDLGDEADPDLAYGQASGGGAGQGSSYEGGSSGGYSGSYQQGYEAPQRYDQPPSHQQQEYGRYGQEQSYGQEQGYGQQQEYGREQEYGQGQGYRQDQDYQSSGYGYGEQSQGRYEQGGGGYGRY